MYRTLFSVQGTAQCTGHCLLDKPLHGTQGTALCTGHCLVYKALHGVQGTAQCTGHCLVYQTLHGVQGTAQCTGDCLVDTPVRSAHSISINILYCCFMIIDLNIGFDICKINQTNRMIAVPIGVNYKLLTHNLRSTLQLTNNGNLADILYIYVVLSVVRYR